MNRREFFGLKNKKQSVDVPVRIAADGIAPYQGSWTEVQVKHLLKRTMFGAKYSDIQQFGSLAMEACVDQLIYSTEAEPLPPVNSYSPARPDPNVPEGETWVNDPTSVSSSLNTGRRESLHSWWWGLMVGQSRTLREKMVLFWHNHLVVEYPGINPRYLYQYNVVLRRNALGNFRTLLRDMTLNPAMLVYLSGDKNTAAAPNENYARELQELFAIGKGPDSKYTEQDVQEAAKVLTGYQIDSVTAMYKFTPTRHSTSNKTFSAFYNNRVITGRSGTAGEQELDELLDMLLAQPEAAKFICRKLYRFFVYYEIDEQVESQVIEPLAAIFRQNNYEIKPVLEALFKSEHFYNPLNIGCMIKSPVDFSVGLVREFNIQFPDANLYYADTYSLWRYILLDTNKMGQEIGLPPDVSGWPAYYQEPQFHQLWINSNSLPLRSKFSDYIVSTGYVKNGKKAFVDVLTYAASLPDASEPNALLDMLIRNLFMLGLSPTSKEFIKKEMLLSGQDSDHYWTTAWENYMANPSSTTNRTIVLTRLRALVQYLMNLPEYQLS
ncbi:MAG: DUF1800 domain-containing protein [Paludibacter sp.]|jgi:uncharacterized protein (DUF1800 family)|nr:DUF1800 domain-containing protein [Paludibacter sp.]